MKDDITVVIEDKGEKGDRGEQGIQGVQGEKGDTGMSAYESAKLGGYTKTEPEFYDDLAYIQQLYESIDDLSEVAK